MNENCQIGCGRLMMFWLQAAEIAIVATISLALAAAGALGLVLATPYFVKIL